MRGRTLALAIAASTAALVLPARAAAQDLQTRAAAEQLFKDGTEAMARHDYATACPKLEEVTKLLPGKIGAMWRFAACLEEWGKLASAWAEYRVIASTAPPTDDLKRASQDKAGALEPRLSRLTITVPVGAPSGLVVMRDGVGVGPAELGTAIPVDAGTHTVTASEPQKKAWTGSVDVPIGKAASLDVPALWDEATPPPSAPLVVQPPDGPSAAPATGAPRWAWGVGGAGIVVVTAGAITLGLGEVANHKIASGQTDRTKQASDQSSVAAALWSGGILMTAGVAGILAGVVGVMTVHKQRMPARLHCAPLVSRNLGGGALEGSF